MLGTLELWHDGEQTVIGAAKLRALLALLVLSANQVVRRDQLIDELWDGDPPPSATGTLQANVYRLRRLLQASEVSLETRESGYTLQLPADAVDLHRFQRLVDDAHGLIDAGDTGSAVDTLRDALRLWRGEAFADVEVATVRTSADTLRERRWDATELYLSSVLALGKHAEALGELEEYVAANPLRERGWELLITAQYQAGRQAEALDSYRRVRELLDEQLGIEPGRALRDLQQRILNADPSLDPPTDDAPVHEAEQIVPRQLPTPVRHLAGRADLLTRLDDARGHVVLLTGGAGIGKTTLAVYWAERVRDHFPDGVLFHDLRGFGPTERVVEPASVLPTLLAELGVPSRQIPNEVEAQSALLRSVLADRQALLVLDNASDADQVRPLLPGAGRSTALVTSRRDLTGLVTTHDARAERVELLTDQAARELLESRVGAERVAAEPDAVADLIAGCAGLPLALAIVASRAATRPAWPMSAVAVELMDVRRGLDAFRSEDRSADLTVVLSWSYRALGPDAARLFRLLGLHPGPDISLAAAASLAGWDTARTQRCLDELTACTLLDENVPGRYSFHDLLRAYAAELAAEHDAADVRHTAIGRMIDHYLYAGHAGAMRLSSRRDPIKLAPAAAGVEPEPMVDLEQTLDWFDTEHLVLLGVVDLAASHGYDAQCWQVAWTLVDFLDWRGHWQDWVNTQHVALEAARRADDRRAEATSHRYLASAATELRHTDDAFDHLGRSLSLLRELDDTSGQGFVHIGLANVLESQRRWVESKEHGLQALELFRSAGHRLGEANALNSAGWLSAMLGEYDEGADYGEQAAAIFEEIGASHGLAAASHTLGYVHHRRGDLARAIETYQRSLDLYTAIGGDRYYEATGLDSLGDAYHDAGDHDAAREMWQRALTILDELGHPEAEVVRAKAGGPPG